MKITVLKICMPEGINYLKKWNVYTSTVLLNTIIEAEQKCWNLIFLRTHDLIAL
jgi:hypothetical protein